MAPFATYLIFNFNWRIAFIIIGLITSLIVIPFSRLLNKDPKEIGSIPDGSRPDRRKDIGERIPSQSKDLSVFQAFRTRSFWLITFAWGGYSFGMFLMLTHLVPHVTDIGFSAVEAALVMSLIGGANIGGKLVFGLATDRLGKKPVAIISFLLFAGVFVWLLWAGQLWMIYAIGLAFGLSWGGFSTSTVALVGDTFGVARSGAIFGALEIGFGLGAALGPAIAGHIYDVSGSYSPAFFTGAVIMFLVSLAILLIRRETSEHRQS
jgi:predicted MFS family arabinose efflux permease